MVAPAMELSKDSCQLHDTLAAGISEAKCLAREYSKRPTLTAVLMLLGGVMSVMIFLFGFVMAQFTETVSDIQMIETRIRSDVDTLGNKVDSVRLDVRELQTLLSNKEIKHSHTPWKGLE